jgi:hypothetical protein
MAIYVGVNGVPKEVSGVYVGVNGTPKEVSEVYAGYSGNTPKSVYSSVKPGETIFTSSSTFTVPKGVTSIDVFCVGGGAKGYCDYHAATDSGSYIYTSYTSCASCNYTTYGSRTYIGSATGNFYSYYCGNGGNYYTKTGISVTPNTKLSVTVGAGGTASSGSTSSSIGSLCTSASGYTAAFGAYGNTEFKSATTYTGLSGTSYYGKCSSCGKTAMQITYTTTYYIDITDNYAYSYSAKQGGYAFGDTSKGLYGCGGGYRTGSAGTGDGGDSSSVDTSYTTTKYAAGYSGVVMIKWSGK